MKPTGNAIIQVDSSGDNCILLYAGANHCITEEYIDLVLDNFGRDDVLVIQNEINSLKYLVDRAYEKGAEDRRKSVADQQQCHRKHFEEKLHGYW